MTTKHEKFGASLAARGGRAPRCRAPILKDLTPEQLAALHVCKHEIVAAVFRLYMSVPQDTADQILGNYIAPLEDWPDD